MVDPAEENLRNILASPSYVKAREDVAFLQREELRGVRLLLELDKTEAYLREHGVRSTIVVFGGTRVVERSLAQARLTEAQAAAAANPADAGAAAARDELTPRSPGGAGGGAPPPNAAAAVERAERVLAKSRYYDEARELARIISSTCQRGGFCDFVVTTGGGPGVMEAANRGAFDVSAKSVGLNITLPHEQSPNPYITPELCFQFHYFAIRKMHFLLRAKALVAFPGGFGTLDELFETLTLVQTGKMPRLPIVLFGRPFWEKLINWPFLVEEGVVAEEDIQLFSYAETANEAWRIIMDFYAR